MNTHIYTFALFLLLFGQILYSCQTSDKAKRTQNNQIVLDEEYGKPKVIYLDDVATFEYIPLETTEKSLLDKHFRTCHIDDNDIIITNKTRGEVIFFSRKGKYKNSFSCKGSGPNEIHQGILGSFWDVQNREIFINDFSASNRILVFDENGIFLRSFSIENQFEIKENIADFDKNHFLAYDEKNTYTQDPYVVVRANPSPYILFSKKDGKKVGELPFHISKRISTNFHRDIPGSQPEGSVTTGIYPFKKSGDEFIICDIGMDTIYSYQPKTGTAIPLFSKIPELQLQESPKTIVALFDYNDRYIHFFRIINYYDFETKKNASHENIVYDSQKKSFYSVIFKQRTGAYSIPRCVQENPVLPKNTSYFSIPAEKLHEKFSEDRITDSQLKKIASTIKEDDNEVLLLIHYKN